MRKENSFDPGITNFPVRGPGLLDLGVNIYEVIMI